jgi:DNA-directed RNA polymerase specialized sigma24 family protein
MPTLRLHQDEDLARRVYAYFIFRLRQPQDAEQLTRLSFERIWREENLSRVSEQEPDVPTFAAARAVIADNPRPRGASKVAPLEPRTRGDDGFPTGLSTDLAMAIGRLHGRERDAIALRFGADLSIGEIAEVLDRTPAEVKQRLARGVRTLLELGVLPKGSRGGSSAAERPGARSPEQGKTEQEKPDD